MVGKTISFLKELYLMDIGTILEYRFNFLAQSIGMIINDLFWIFFWFLLFQNFGNIGGWQFEEMMLLYSIIVTSFGFVSITLANFDGLVNLIENGGLDYYLTLPKNVWLHSMIKIRYSGAGDFVLGIIIASLTITFKQIPLFLILIICSSLIFLGWFTLMNSIAFFAGRFETAAEVARTSLVTLAMYPFSVYSGLTKFVLLVIIPAGFVGGIPVELLTNFSAKWFIATIIFSIVFFALGLFMFYKGLKKYESGNAIIMRG